MNRTNLKQALVVLALAVVPMAANSADFDLEREMSRTDGCPYGETAPQTMNPEEFALEVISGSSDDWLKAEMTRTEGDNVPYQPSHAKVEGATKEQ